MLVKQKEANRQSMLLLQNAEPSVQLLKALEDVAAITKTLEEERLQHQQKVNKRSEAASAYCQEGGVYPGRAEGCWIDRKLRSQ